MLHRPRSVIYVAPQYQPIFCELAIDAEAVFDHPHIQTWRKLSDRENCTLDAQLADGHAIRWHVKRYEPTRGLASPAEVEVRGHRALMLAEIPTASLVAWGTLASRRSFVIFNDLDGYAAADKLIESGMPFERLLNPTADLAARLHRGGLHHRDLYLCHFFAKLAEGEPDVRLIDAARLRRLPGLFTRTRWIVKDLAQFFYSTTSLPITDEQRSAWLSRYAEQCGMPSAAPLRRSIERKVGWIARHDLALRRRQPTRNVSIPSAPG